jgi:predicted Fe-Mo cluster-binding NifX family protein
MAMTKLGIPRFKDEIAPLFDAASHLAIYQIERDAPRLAEVVVVETPQALDRVRALRQAGISILICNGIGSQAQSMLQTSGVTVINHVAGSVENALRAFYSGELCGSSSDAIFQQPSDGTPLGDLVTQVQALFTKHGYKVSPGGDRAPFPVDLEAEILCPTCGRPVRVAICCGMHAYRIDEEIRAFHDAAEGVFNAMIFAHAGSFEVEKTCADFGIQFLDPLSAHQRKSEGGHDHGLPLLKKRIRGHESCFKTK